MEKTGAGHNFRFSFFVLFQCNSLHRITHTELTGRFLDNVSRYVLNLKLVQI